MPPAVENHQHHQHHLYQHGYDNNAAAAPYTSDYFTPNDAPMTDISTTSRVVDGSLPPLSDTSAPSEQSNSSRIPLAKSVANTNQKWSDVSVPTYHTSTTTNTLPDNAMSNTTVAAAAAAAATLATNNKNDNNDDDENDGTVLGNLVRRVSRRVSNKRHNQPSIAGAASSNSGSDGLHPHQHRGLEEGPGRQQSNGGYYDRHGGDINRNKSLVRPERNRVAYDPRSPQYRMANRPEATAVANTNRGQVMAPQLPPVDDNNGDDRHGPSRGNTIQRRNNNNTTRDDKSNNANKKKRTCPTCWVLFSRIITFYAPRPVLRCFGMRNAEVQQAWREKMALVTIIFILCLAVGFLTFGFQQVVCFNSARRVPGGNIPSASAVIHGKMYDLRRYRHPLVTGITDGDITGDPVNAGGKDLSLRFQLLNSNCADVLRARDGQGDPSGAPYAYFPCQDVDPYSSVDPSQTARSGCHLTGSSRRDLRSLRLVGDVFYTWDQVANRKTNYVIYNSQVLDLDRIGWFLNSVDVPAELVALQQDRSARGRDITLRMSTTERRRKIARCMVDTLKIGSVDTNSIGCIASDIVLYVSLVVIVGVVIIKFFLAVLFSWVLSWRLGAVRKESMEERYRRIEAIEQWSEDIHSQQYGGGAGGANTASTPTGTFSRPKPQRNSLLPSYSRFSTRPVSTSVVTGADEATFGAAPMPGGHRVHSSNTMVTYPEQQLQQQQPGSRSFLNIPANSGTNLDSRHTSANGSPHGSGPPSPRLAPSSHHGTENSRSRLSMVAPHQLPTGMDPTLAAAALTDSPYDFPLAYTILLVTCYSEGEEGLRTTLDSLANTDYPQSHKLILVICDGIITGAGNTKSTPDICLSMMKDFIIPPEQVQAHSYVAIADGTKRHNMAKVYAGYYDFNNGNANAPIVPMVTIVKCGAPAEASQPKPGNRGKRDSQIILMGFLQRVMFDERMTELEYEFFNAIWTVVGVPPDRFEIVLMVDADTKVYPDSLTRMVACMMRDPSVMGLCGETKIANKKQSWVTMIQGNVEYYISHHMSKAFESVFGGVTCLPGCFCMYRIKAPKGPNGFYVPILANPDIVENYSENVVDTLHKKNLLLLGEDRFLTTLMLRTFPKRKMMFLCARQLYQMNSSVAVTRRRWINSTVHNLLELVLIRDLCGTFCFSMQFVIFMELIGTVVLPAAITFTIYLIIISFFTDPVPIIPLLLLAAILGLPAVLILMTTRKIVYVMWMLIYLASLPLWNFILPVYAFWHFDDFSWGQTRMVEGEAKGKAHGGKEGEFDSSQITMKRWCEFEREKRRRTMAILASGGVNNYRHSSIAPTNSVASSSYQLNASKPSLNEIGYTAPSTTSVLGLDQIPGRNSSRGSLLAQPPSAPFMYDDGWDRHSNRSGNSDGTGTPGTPGTATGYSSAGGGGTSSSFGEDHQPLSSSLPR
ncbi:chitin synthase-domain-containing protein [Syncephalis plumigaleata]|nr:chitin synthase-domain-containing protein [Syncephalis plumigaleata]